MKALHIISDLSTAGAQTVVMNYLRYFKKDPSVEIIVAVIGCPHNTTYEQEIKKNNYVVYFCNYEPLVSIYGIGMFVNWIRQQFIIYKKIKELKPDVIHSHGTKRLPFLLLPALFSGVKKKFHTLHSDPYALPKRYVIWARIAFNLGNFVPICVTEEQAQKALQRYHIKKYQIVKNGIDAERFVHRLSRDSIKREIGLPENAFVIGCVARLDKVKNHPFLIKVFFEYQKIHPNAVLILLGEGSQYNNLFQLTCDLGIAEKVLFLGTRDSIERYYYAMDVFCLTSFFESSSIVTVEAQFAGIKCVISDSIPQNVVLTHNVNRLSLNEPIEKWIAAIDGKLPCDLPVGVLEDYSLKQAAMKLKHLYSD